MRKRLEKKELYTLDDLLNHKLSLKERDEKLINSICDIMLRMVGKDFKWAKEHDYEDLHIIDLIFFDKNTYNEFEKSLIPIIKKQLGISKKHAEKEASHFLFFTGLTFYDHDSKYNNLEIVKESVRRKIKMYEDKHGKLKYCDGWEVELKEWCGYEQ